MAAYRLLCPAFFLCHLCKKFIHDLLDRIAGIVKRNILCIVVFPAILIPLSAENVTIPDFLHDLRVLRQNLSAAALFRCPFQCPLQRCLVALGPAQSVQNVDVVVISRTGVCNIAGQYGFQLFGQNCLKIVGQNADCAVVEQH